MDHARRPPRRQDRPGWAARRAEPGRFPRDAALPLGLCRGRSAGDGPGHRQGTIQRCDAATGITYSSGSNYGPSSGVLLDEVKARVAILRASGVSAEIPVDLVTKSASGLDPHLSPAAIEVQVPRIAAIRGLPASKVRELVAAHTEQSSFGFVGEPRVNVLLLNLDLDQRAPYAHPVTESTTAK